MRRICTWRDVEGKRPGGAVDGELYTDIFKYTKSTLGYLYHRTLGPALSGRMSNCPEPKKELRKKYAEHSSYARNDDDDEKNLFTTRRIFVLCARARVYEMCVVRVVTVLNLLAAVL